MKNILVTGANGYIGARLVDYFVKNNYNVFGQSLEKHEDSERTKLFSGLIIGDIRDEAIQNQICNLNVDALIHLVSLDHHKSDQEPSLVTSVNVSPTWSLLKKFSETKLKKFIYFSTIHVYGSLTPEIITENHQCKPENAYALTHLLSEEVVNYFNRKNTFEAINLRLSNSYGSPVYKNNNCWWLVINDLCKTAISQKKIIIKSDGSPQRDFIHLSDVCRAVVLLLNSDTKEHNLYHISSSKTLTILELAHVIKNVYQEIFKEEIPIEMPDSSDTSLEKYMSLNRYTIDNTRMKQLGFQTEFNLQSGIKELFNFLKDN